MDQQNHWERVYTDNQRKSLGWYAPHLQTSLRWIKGLALGMEAPIIDVGGGASKLAGDLLEAGYQSITVLDISASALSSGKENLGKKSDLVNWLEGDITSLEMPAHYYALWHDRAMFHFLIEPEQQSRYRDQLTKALQPGGNLIIGTFAPEAPPRCSGLPVQRYSREQLDITLGKGFELKRHRQELHVTPGGVEQMYLYCHFRKVI
jgi:ubiquinone/menaquinone biosynthesis C-methylase UbiE